MATPKIVSSATGPVRWREYMAMTADIGLVFGVVLSACFVGIVSRPAGLLAAVWPANALLLGLFVRFPRLATPAGWLAAIAAYFAADLLTGGTILKTLLLTAGNLAGVVVGFALFMRLDAHDRDLTRPFSVLYLGLITSAAAAACAVVGSIANPVLFHGGALEGAVFWFVTEFVNYIAFLPVMLTLPVAGWQLAANWSHGAKSIISGSSAPFLALIVSCVGSLYVGGPGAMAFPVPALLWCALVYELPGTAIVTVLFSTWTLVAISSGAIHVGADFNSMASMLSIRIGVALMALAPITVASVMAARNEFQILLQRMITNDPLTAALNRRAFAVRCRNLLAPLAEKQSLVAVLIFNLDRFRDINRSHGHAAGDETLKAFARTARAFLPHADDFGRLGGDEFAVLLSVPDAKEAKEVAEMISRSFAEKRILWGPSNLVRSTVSVGVALTERIPLTVEPLLTEAEKALERAKASGGNRVALADAHA